MGSGKPRRGWIAHATVRLLFCLCVLVSAQAWATDWHVCPDTDAANVAIEYGAEDGTSEADCFDGNADAWATAGDIDAVDTVYYHGTFYHERIVVSDSGTSGSPITLDFTDAVIWHSVDISGDNTVAATTYEQRTGSTWALVDGTTNLYKKGIGVTVTYGPVRMWVNGVMIDNASVVPATQNSAGVIAVIGDNEFTMTTEDTDSLLQTLYYKGTLSDDMRWWNMSTTTETNTHGAIVVNGYDYIALVNPICRGYGGVSVESGCIFIQDSTGSTIDGGRAYESRYGLRIQNNTNLDVDGIEVDANLISGIALAGQHHLSPAGVVGQITAVTQANPGKVTTASAHGLTTGEKISMVYVGGMTQISATTEYTVTEVDADEFTIGVNTSGFSAYTSGGQIWVGRTDTNTQIHDSYIHNNANYPSALGSSIGYTQDGDGIGVGYKGGTVAGLRVYDNRIHSNGPARALIAGETGSVAQGSGMFVGTAFTQPLTDLYIGRNDFYANHQYNLNINQATSSEVSGNLFRGTVQYDTTLNIPQMRYQSLASTSAHKFINNTMTGNCATMCVRFTNDAAAKTLLFANNIFANITADEGTAGSPWIGVLNLTSTQATVTDRENRFVNITPAELFARNGTQYTTVSAWDTAISQTTGDEVVADAGFEGGTTPSTVIGHRLTPSSALRRAGYDANMGNYSDYGNRAFLHPPSIGAWEATSGDAADTRTAR